MRTTEQIRTLYLRCAKDSRFQMDYIELAHFVARLLGADALLVWSTFPNLRAMEDVAAGTHPIWQKQA